MFIFDSKNGIIMEGMSLGHFYVMYLILAGQSLTCDDELILFINDALQFVSVFIILISHSAHMFISQHFPSYLSNLMLPENSV